MMSGRFTPAARTAIRIWPSPGVGTGILTGFSASGGPLPPSTAIAVISWSDMAAGPPELAPRRFGLQIAARDRQREPPMAEEPAEPRRARGQALLDVTKEDLELFGTDELEQRIA